MVDIRVWTNSVPSGKSVVLGGDIGGTNTNFVLATTAKKPSIITSFHFSTNEIKDIAVAIKVVTDYAKEHKLSIKKGCVAVAGPIDKGKVSGPNIPFTIDIKKMSTKTKLKLSIVNDFEAIAAGIEVLPPKDLIVIQKGKTQKQGVQAFLGPGTGLGKAFRVWDAKLKSYVAFPSEGGHGDFPFNSSEFDMAKFFVKNSRAPSWEDMVSGKGIESLYTFLRPMAMGNRMVDEIDQSNDKAKLISKYYRKDKLCKLTLDTFARFCGRALKNFCLDTLPYGGAFIAGGVAAKNKQIFGKDFLSEFHNVDPALANVMKNIPITIIANYDVSLYGAVLLA